MNRKPSHEPVTPLEPHSSEQSSRRRRRQGTIPVVVRSCAMVVVVWLGLGFSHTAQALVPVLLVPFVQRRRHVVTTCTHTAEAATKMHKMMAIRRTSTTVLATVLTPNRETVAIIGGGVAGLSCAQHLTDFSRAFDVTVFDTGRLRPGGRCSSRYAGDRDKAHESTVMIGNSRGDGGGGGGIVGDSSFQHRPTYPYLSQYSYDHAAQLIFVPSSPPSPSTVGTAEKEDYFGAFRKQVREWEERGILTRFSPETIFRIPGKSRIVPANLSGSAYYGAGGMGAIPQAMVNQNRFQLKQDVWISPSNGVRYLPQSKRWRLQAKGKVVGEFDRLIIAHNGKCADRLMSTTPCKDVHSLLRVNFSPAIPSNGGKRMTLNSIYSLTICVDGPILSRQLPAAFTVGFIQNHNVLRSLTCQTKKYPPTTKKNENGKRTDRIDTRQDMAYEVWTILSSPSFAHQHRAPQEFIPEEVIDEVSSTMLLQLEELLGLNQEGQTTSTLQRHIVDRRLQLWGAAVPLNVWCTMDGNTTGATTATITATNKAHPPMGFLYDSSYSVGVCGDWLVEPSIAGAWTSGRLLAEYISENIRGDYSDSSSLPKSVGVRGRFRTSSSVKKFGIAALD